LATSGRALTAACLNVYARSGLVDEVYVGTQQELHSKLERCKYEKSLLEKDKKRAEEDNSRLRRDASDVRSKLSESHEEKRALKAANDRLTRKAEAHLEASQHVRLLEARNDQLETSLFDIAQIVLDDADREAGIAADQSTLLRSTSANPLTRGNVATSTPLRLNASGSYLADATLSSSSRKRMTPRRTRSASPAMMESTLSAVQAALNRRQLQVHQLRGKLEAAERSASELEKQARAKGQTAEALQTRLARERGQAEELKRRLAEASRESTAAEERARTLLAERAPSERARDALRDEVESLSAENSLLKEALDRTSKASESARGERERVERKSADLKREMEERRTLVGKLERVGSQLRRELIEAKEKLESAQGELATMKTEAEEREAMLAAEGVRATEAKEKIMRIERAEKANREEVSSLMEIKSQLEKSILSMQKEVER